MRTHPEIRAAIPRATDPGIPRTAARQAPEEVAPDIPFWPVAYGAAARDGLAAATQQEHEAVTAFEEELNELPQACGDLYPDTVGDLYVGRLPGPGHNAWTSVLYHVDNEAQQVLVLAIVSGP